MATHLLDQFTTNAAGPLTGTRTCEPGPGTLTLTATPTSAAISISSNKLTFARPTGAQNYANYGALADLTLARALGVVVYGKINSSIAAGQSFGFNNSAALANSSIQAFNFANTSQLQIGDNNTAITIFESMTASTDYQFAIVLRGNGALYFVRGGSQFQNWTLLWVSQTEITDTLYAMYSNFNSATTLDDFTVKDLSGVFLEEYGGAKDLRRFVADGDAATVSADGLEYITMTVGAGEVFEFMVRRTDDSNCYKVSCDQAGSTIKVIKMEAGSPTEEGSAAQTWTPGNRYRICVRHQGSQVRAFVDKVSKVNITTATFNQSATGAKVSGAVALANWESWNWSWAGTDLDTLSPNGSTYDNTLDQNLLLWVTDPHFSGTGGGIDPMLPREGLALANHIIGLKPVAVIVTGDLGENFGSSANYTSYKEKFRDPLIAAGIEVIDIPGNHDENDDKTVAAPNSWSVLTSVIPEIVAPFHKTYSWTAAKIKVICAHSYIVHAPDVLQSYGQIDQTEIDWVEDELDSLSTGWKAVVMTHFPGQSGFGGNHIHDDKGGTAWRALLAANASKIVFYGSGHTHAAPAVTTLSGITHINGAHGSYWTSWNSGGFSTLRFKSDTGVIQVEARDGRTTYGQLSRSVWTPQEFDIAYAPIITSHPSSATKDPDESVTFSVVAAAIPSATYQWRKDGVNIGGATSASYEIASVTEADEGDYDVVVTNSEGSATSNAATLTVNSSSGASAWWSWWRMRRR